LATLPGTDGLLALVGPKLARVEAEVEANLVSAFGPLDAAGRYLHEGGGKRIRPILVLLTSGLLDYRGEHDVLMGAVFEFIHAATLIHDDIIDGAETRRGRAAFNQVFGNQQTVLYGDYLYIRSMNMALRAGQLRLIDILAHATERMIEGEILGHHLRGRTDVTRDQHLEIVERKTAWLFSACCRVSGVLAGIDRQREEQLATYGMTLGVAFQLVDDLLDVTSDEATMGKPVASDLREGRMTLPWIDLWQRGGENDRAAIRGVIETGRCDRRTFERLRVALERHGALERSRRLAADYAARARDAIDTFADGPHRRVLRELTRAVIERDR
jgi:octaprenyl-diphosphate synthase